MGAGRIQPTLPVLELFLLFKIRKEGMIIFYMEERRFFEFTKPGNMQNRLIRLRTKLPAWEMF